MQDDTRRCKADFYINEDGREITRNQFLRQLLDYQGYMLYVGEGFVPLRVAALTLMSSDENRADAYDAISALEEWCRSTDRLSEIGEDLEENDPGWGEYVYQHERIPMPIVVMESDVAALTDVVYGSSQCRQ